jgi:two-component system, sensor histidine kinase and response regulator
VDKAEVLLRQFSKAEPRQSILVIDDSIEMLMIQRSVLESDGFAVFTAQSGATALEVLSEIDKPDLILLDVQMEDMSGPEFLNILEQNRPQIIKDVPVVFLTAMDEAPIGKATGYIRKLMDIDKFLEAVHRFIKMGSQASYNH